MTEASPRFVAVVGPTASGKTALSVAAARRLRLEVVSMDSRQVYQGMDIGTDKVAPAIRKAVPHHGLDLVRPDERYSAGRFGRDARRRIREIEGRGAVPFLVGGTGFFLRAVMNPIFTEPPMDPQRRDRLRRWLRAQTRERLERFVSALDPERADLAVEGGPQRMSRTIEVALLSGVALSRWHREAPPDGQAVPGLVLVLELPRDQMDRRIETRVERMVEAGMVDEVRRLMAEGYSVDDPGMSGTGYREISRYLEGDLDLDQAMAEMASQTRRYARRQLTWFRNQLPGHARTVDATLPVEDQVAAVLAAMEDVRPGWTRSHAASNLTR